MDRYEKNHHPTFKALRNIDLNLLTIFEAVYIHKGIVNAAKVLNLTPSAISQSIQKLRSTFPDPLFIRKGQGVTPTAYAAHLHEYISQGFESILCALDINNNYEKAHYHRRVLTHIRRTIDATNLFGHSESESEIICSQCASGRTPVITISG